MGTAFSAAWSIRMRVVITYQQRLDASYLDLIKMAFHSASVQGYTTVLVGNIRNYGDHHIEFLPENERLLMNWVLAAQLAYIQSKLFDQPTVIFSPDALILKPLEPIFDQPFDVAFTERDNPKWPINNGVIFIKPENKNKLAAFWHGCLAICKSYPIETQEWYGDQQSIHDALESGVDDDIGLDAIRLPCDIYNASPMRPGQAYSKKLLKDAYIAHFKGKRKKDMKEYWRILCTKD